MYLLVLRNNVLRHLYICIAEETSENVYNIGYIHVSEDAAHARVSQICTIESSIRNLVAEKQLTNVAASHNLYLELPNPSLD